MFKNSNILYISTLLVTSFAFNIYYGSIGVYPIDTFAFFDSAYSINQGFIPIRDYWTSNGFLVDVIQSVFFEIFGVSWHVYLLHSSLVNFILVFFTFKVLTNEGLSLKSSLLYSVLVGILAYPTVGVPFPDHHSLIFSLLSVYFLIFLIKKKIFYIYSRLLFSYLFLFFVNRFRLRISYY